MDDTFGAAFGRLVKRKRGESQPKFTQGALAAALYPNDSDAADKRKGDISKLETGKVANPQTRTVTDIARILNISQDEIDALRKQIQMSPSEKLENLGTLSRDALELLASRFEIPKPHGLSDADLTTQLTLKAQEYHALKSEVDAIDSQMRGLANMKAAAKDAIERLDFAEVEHLLSLVQTAELEVAAATTKLRAKNALMRGKAEQAYRLLSTCADSFGGEDDTAPLRKRQEFQDILYAHALRYGGKGLLMAMQMNRDILDKTSNSQHPQLWAAAQNNLAIALRNQGGRTQGAAGNELLAQAVAAYRAALQVYTQQDHPLNWAMTQNNLAVALQTQGGQTQGAAGNDLLAQAVTALHAALQVYTQQDHPVDWAETQGNLAILFLAQAAHDSCTDQQAALRQALQHVDRALTVFDPEHMTFNHTKASELRGKILAALEE